MTLRYDTRSRVSTYTQSWVSNADPDFGAFESITTTTLSTATASVTFSSIPATYKHLQLRCLARTNRADVSDQLRIQINSDTASNYSTHSLSCDGASATAGGTANETYMFLGRAAGASASASIFGVTVIDIVDYANTSKYKTFRGLAGTDFNGSGNVSLLSGAWRNTAAITSVQVTFIGSLMSEYSHFALYGIKA